MVTPEQLMSAHKANLEIVIGLQGKAFEAAEKLVALNVAVAKAAQSEAAESIRAAFAVKDVQELLALQAGALQPSAERAAVRRVTSAWAASAARRKSWLWARRSAAARRSFFRAPCSGRFAAPAVESTNAI